MKLAIVCPIGDLNRFGYWRMAQTCLESWQAIGTLFLIHSSRSSMPFMPEQAHYLRDERTLMQLTDGQERFDHRVVAHNANIGLDMARQAGYDCAITICVNWYIELWAARAIESKCRRLIEEQYQSDFLFRRMQVGKHLFDADLGSPVVINIGEVAGDAVRVLADKLTVGGQIFDSRRDHFPSHNTEAYIDVGLDITDDEAREKFEDVRNYEDILPKRRGADFAFWERYFAERKRKLRLSPDAPGPVGMRIAALRPAHTFGERLL